MKVSNKALLDEGSFGKKSYWRKFVRFSWLDFLIKIVGLQYVCEHGYVGQLVEQHFISFDGYKEIFLRETRSWVRLFVGRIVYRMYCWRCR